MVDEKLIEEIESGKREEDIYTEEGREVEVDSDAVDDIGAGFIEGFEEEERAVNCAKCKKLLTGDYVEVEIDGENYRFCSEECAETFQMEKK